MSAGKGFDTYFLELETYEGPGLDGSYFDKKMTAPGFQVLVLGATDFGDYGSRREANVPSPVRLDLHTRAEYTLK